MNILDHVNDPDGVVRAGTNRAAGSAGAAHRRGPKREVVSWGTGPVRRESC